MKAELTVEETSLLLDVLKEYLGELRSEIHDTDNFKYKKNLQEKEQTLLGIVAKLERESVAA